MTYASRLRARLDMGPGFPGKTMTHWVLERMAEEEFKKKVTGGFDKNRKCPTCLIALPITGQCDYH